MILFILHFNLFCGQKANFNTLIQGEKLRRISEAKKADLSQFTLINIVRKVHLRSYQFIICWLCKVDKLFPFRVKFFKVSWYGSIESFNIHQILNDDQKFFSIPVHRPLNLYQSLNYLYFYHAYCIRIRRLKDIFIFVHAAVGIFGDCHQIIE